jgi:predicted secreted hydrolase
MAKPVFFGVTPDFLAREGLTETVQPWEDGLRAETGPGSFEWWYFDAHLDNNTTVVMVFATKPILERGGPLKPTVLLTLNCPNGKRISRAAYFPASQFSAARETCNVAIGPNRAQGDLRTYQLHVEMEADPASDAGSISLDLTFTGLVPPWRPGAGKSCFGDLNHYFAWLPAIPYGRVAGEITCDGKVYQVSGAGYHDHNWGNIGLNEVMDHWYWGRARIGDYALIYVEQIGAQEYGYTRMPVFLLAKGDQVLTGDGSKLTMKTADFVPHPRGRAWPREVDFYWRDGSDSIHISLRQPQLIEAVSLLASFPTWKRALLRLFANPYYFRFNAEMVLSLHLGSLHATERGPALFEIMILQGKRHP